MKEFAVSLMLIVAITLVAQKVTSGPHASFHGTKEVGGPVSGVTVPKMNKGYPCELGELGRRDSYENKERFWGDDSVSQGFKKAGEGAIRGIDGTAYGINRATDFMSNDVSKAARDLIYGSNQRTDTFGQSGNRSKVSL